MLWFRIDFHSYNKEGFIVSRLSVYCFLFLILKLCSFCSDTQYHLLQPYWCRWNWAFFCNVCVHLGWEFGLRVCVGHWESVGGGGCLRGTGRHTTISLLYHLPSPPGQKISQSCDFWTFQCTLLKTGKNSLSFLVLSYYALKDSADLHLQCGCWFDLIWLN